MKKTIAAAILLALLSGAAAWNIAHIDALTGSLTALAEDALESCRAEDYDAAESAIECLKAHLRSIASMEHVSIKSVL